MDRLLADGHRVVGVDNLSTGRPGNLAAARHDGRFRWIRADVSKGLRRAGRPTRVWHLASPASPPDYLEHPIETLLAGSEGTRHALDVARRSDAAFLLASTSEVYGDPDVSPQSESYWGRVNPVGPRSVYDEAKRYAEALTMAYHRTYGLQTRIARIFNTYGPRMRLDDGRVVPNLISQALRGRPLTVYGNGKQTRSFCYYTDLIEGLVRCMRSRDPHPVNLGSTHEIRINEFARRIQKLAGRRLRIVHRPLPQDDPTRRRPDIRRARRLLRWAPTVSLDEGLKRTWEYFQGLPRST